MATLLRLRPLLYILLLGIILIRQVHADSEIRMLRQQIADRASTRDMIEFMTATNNFMVNTNRSVDAHSKAIISLAKALVGR